MNIIPHTHINAGDTRIKGMQSQENRRLTLFTFYYQGFD